MCHSYTMWFHRMTLAVVIVAHITWNREIILITNVTRKVKYNFLQTTRKRTKNSHDEFGDQSLLLVKIVVEIRMYRRNNNKLFFFQPDTRSPCLLPSPFCSKIKSFLKTQSRDQNPTLRTNHEDWIMTQHTRVIYLPICQKHWAVSYNWINIFLCIDYAWRWDW